MKFFVPLACSLAAVLVTALPGIAQVRITYNFSQVTNSLQLSNTPLAEAISMASRVTGTDIVIDTNSIEAAGISLRKPVTTAVSNATVLEILSAILPESLAARRQGGKIVVSTRERIDAGATCEIAEVGNRDDGSVVRGMVRAETMGLESAMQQRIPVHFQHTPLEFAVQMLAGFSGMHAHFDASARYRRMVPVTLHRDGATIRENLDELLDAAGLTWEIPDHATMIIRARDSR